MTCLEAASTGAPEPPEGVEVTARSVGNVPESLPLRDPSLL
jgi:hypothetical protein